MYKIVYKTGKYKGVRFVTSSYKTKAGAVRAKKKYDPFDVGKKIKVVKYKKRKKR